MSCVVFAVMYFSTVTAFENSALMGYYAASSVNFLSTFRDNISLPSSGHFLFLGP